MRKSDVMMMCSYNNHPNGMILTDDVNAQSKSFGVASRRFIWYQRYRDFWWQNVYSQNGKSTRLVKAARFKKNRKRLLYWHKNTKLAPNLRRGKDLRKFGILDFKKFSRKY